MKACLKRDLTPIFICLQQVNTAIPFYMHSTYHCSPFAYILKSTSPDGADAAILRSTDVAFLLSLDWSLPSANPSLPLPLLSITCNVFLTNFTCPLPWSSYPSSSFLLHLVLKLTASSSALQRHPKPSPKYMFSQCDPELFNANAPLRDP